MTKFFSYTIIGFLYLLMLASCGGDTCTSCTYQLNGQEVSSGEKCGRMDEVEDFETAFRAISIVEGAEEGAVECIRN